MKDLICKLEQLYGKEKKYLTRIEQLFVKYSSLHFDCLRKLEQLEYSDELKIKIESVGEITLDNINTYYNSLFNANSSANYSLIIKKIKEYLEKYKLKLNLESCSKDEIKINYEKIEMHILSEIKEFINGFHLPLQFDYKLLMEKVKEVTPDENSSENTQFSGVEYLNLELIPTLLDKVLEYLPHFNMLIDLHSLLSIQQVDFSTTYYNAIKDCFIKVKNSKLLKIDIKAIITKLEESYTEEIYDILSDNYITFVATLLESSYFLCKYFIEFNSNKNKPKKVKHKNELPLINYIEESINLYMDEISYIDSINVIDLYVTIHNSIVKLDQNEMLKKLTLNK